VQGVDEQAVRDVLVPSVRLALMQVLSSLPRACAERNRFGVEAGGEALLVNAGRSLGPKEVPELVTQSLAILNALVEVRCRAEEHTA
jgi:hypothetical protein